MRQHPPTERRVLGGVAAVDEVKQLLLAKGPLGRRGVRRLDPAADEDMWDAPVVFSIPDLDGRVAAPGDDVPAVGRQRHSTTILGVVR